MDEAGRLLEILFKTTKELLDTILNGDIEKTGEIIKQRQECIDSFGNILPYDGWTKEQKDLIAKILDYDKAADEAIRVAKENCGHQVLHFKGKSRALLSYNNSKYDMSRGQLVDKKR